MTSREMKKYQKKKKKMTMKRMNQYQIKMKKKSTNFFRKN